MDRRGRRFDHVARGALPRLARSIVLACVCLVAAIPARGQPMLDRAMLSTDLATLATSSAVAHCAARGYHVTAVMLNADGSLQAVLRGDGAAPYAFESARMKAYTIVNLGPIRQVEATSDLARQVLSDAASTQLANIPGVIFVAGGVLIRWGSQPVAALGVAGAPGGALDEACAQAGAASVRDRLTTNGASAVTAQSAEGTSSTQPAAIASALHVVAVFATKPQRADEAAVLLSAHTDDSRRDDGNISFATLRDKGKPNQFTTVEIWRDEAALEAHQSTAHYRAFKAQLAPLLLDEPRSQLMRLVR